MKFEIGTSVDIKTGHYSGQSGFVEKVIEDHMGDFEYAIRLTNGNLSTPIWSTMLVENTRNNLPAWKDDILPNEIKIHILQNHTLGSIYNNKLYGRIGYTLKTHEKYIISKFGNIEYKRAKDNLQNKVANQNSLNKKEQGIVDYLILHDGKDLFPISMSPTQIFRAIRNAYQDASKISKRQISTQRDDHNTNTNGGRTVESILYQGKASNSMYIRFYFDFESITITTAYPYDPAREKRERFLQERFDEMERKFGI